MRKFEAIRTEIKKLSGRQKFLKPTRKSAGEYRSMVSGISYEDILRTIIKNKYELRHLFQAYTILKGIDRPVVKKPSNYNGLILDEKKVQEMVEIFTPIEVEQDAVAS